MGIALALAMSIQLSMQVGYWVGRHHDGLTAFLHHPIATLKNKGNPPVPVTTQPVPPFATTYTITPAPPIAMPILPRVPDMKWEPYTGFSPVEIVPLSTAPYVVPCTEVRSDASL